MATWIETGKGVDGWGVGWGLGGTPPSVKKNWDAFAAAPSTPDIGEQGRTGRSLEDGTGQHSTARRWRRRGAGLGMLGTTRLAAAITFPGPAMSGGDNKRAMALEHRRVANTGSTSSGPLRCYRRRRRCACVRPSRPLVELSLLGSPFAWLPPPNAVLPLRPGGGVGGSG